MNNHQNHRHSDRQHKDVEVEIGQRFPLTIKRLGINGEGIGYYQRKICFVPFALPGEVVVAEVTEADPRFIRAKIHKLRKPSPHRVEPADDYAQDVGGFELEHLAYPQQLEFKRDLIRQALDKFKPTGYHGYTIHPTLGMDMPYEYRNKAQFQIRMIDGHVAAGLYQSGSHDLVDLESCSVQIPVTMTVMRDMVKLIEELEIPVYDEKTKAGIIKTVVVRVADGTGEVQLTIITNTPKLPHKHQLLEQIEQRLPEVTSVMQNINPGTSPLVWGDETIHLAGNDAITEMIGGLKFRLSARAFLQLNPEQTKVLYEQTAKALKPSRKDTLIDAYAGIGTIGLSFANQVDQVLGMEVIPDAVADAKYNAEQNNIDNAQYEVGTAEKVMPRWLNDGVNFDALVVDPPRSGLDGGLIKEILRAKPEKFVYVSCNPSTLARDLVPLTKVYDVKYMQPVDMMPQTPKCEVVVKLVKSAK
ncbi:23S rRNA (uracil(1939)-C(5))-methyltransferase RlmD [Paucilactobacillus suebicus]|uniref:23S rRNA (Uracil-5-)-methyltransferase n=1 Tax=Paucilactobacillus suebicus DSM 5007 = KCTC 3549 TaxID=1423807 RepID=A0A0R1VUI6_9LACO|nr:23S rRNA (uracil(1939)-C(5))-methyltransferase RlmD [Paucilactobacillus suebicus]KRM09432.1 23S rRNA (uracil-5-)-methyltransferase [Paucilactobacillus suebicus DSM 5007 = KCTC 3549]